MEHKKIILMYDFLSEHGGVERIMLFQARALKKAGYDVSFAFAYVDEKIKEEMLNDFEVIEYSRFPVKNETIQISKSIFWNRSIEKFKDAKLIICHSFPASYFAFRIKKKFGVPFILHLHHPPQFLYDVSLDWAKGSPKRKIAYFTGGLLRIPLRIFDKFCVMKTNDYFIESKSVQRIIKNTYGINGIILYPTANEKFKIGNYSPKELQKYYIKKDYILGSGRIINQKRFDYLVNAFSRIKNKNLQLVLAGDYNLKTKWQLEKLAGRLNTKILFLGHIPLEELVKLYNLAKVTVHTCPKEWFGLVPVESITCGCPAISWRDNFGPQETIIEGANGFLAEPYDTNNLSEKIEESLAKEWDKRKISKTAEMFSEKEVTKKLLHEVDKFFNF